MGYNGSNRRFRSSVIRKSSLNFGTILVSSIIAIPIAAVLKASFTKGNSMKVNSKIRTSNSSKQNIENTIKIPLNTISSTTGRYKYIIAELDALLKENQSLEKSILLKNDELKRLKLRKRLFILFPTKRKKIEIDIVNLINEIEDLNSRKQVEVLNVEELRNVKREAKISSLKELLSSSKISISNDSISLFDTQRVYNSFILNRVKAQISIEPNMHISCCPVLTITAPYINLFFSGMAIVIKCGEKFAIVDYMNLNLKYQEVKIKEDEHFNIDGYVLDSYTFLHSRNDERADLRYNYNPQIPIIKYGKLSLEMNKHSTLNLFFDNYTIGLQLYEAINTVSYPKNQNTEKINTIIEANQYEVEQNIQIISRHTSIEEQVHQKHSSKPYTIVNLSNSWNNEMHELLANADSLVKNKKYEKANTLYNKLMDVAILQNNSLYSYIASERLKESKNKMHLLENCYPMEAYYPNVSFNIEMINEIIEEAKFHEAKKDYKKALSKYMEVKMYGIMYSSLPYIDFAKAKIEKLNKLEKIKKQ